MQKIPLTVAGAEKLKAELQQLKSVARPEVIAAIAEARSHGDLSENAEYEAAKDRQGFIEGRIAELESKLSHAQIIDPKEIEADIKIGKISVNSPIARAMIGKEEGDVAEVQAPSGVREYDILNVQYI